MTIVKILSVCGTLFLTAAFSDLLKASGVERRNALLLLVLPSVVFNDALLAQCDALWAGACVFALARMMRGQTPAAMVSCGVAIAFKAQGRIHRAGHDRRDDRAARTLVAVGRARAGLSCDSGSPVVDGLAGSETVDRYLDQAAWDRIPGRLANPWMLGTMFADHASRDWFALGYGAAGAAATAIGVLAARNARNPQVLILLGALAGTALPFLLPKMLERYYFLGDVLTLALAFSMRNRPAVYAMLAVQAASILSHITLMYFFYDPYPSLAGALFAAAGLWIISRLAVGELKPPFGPASLATGSEQCQGAA
jgi:hypothetical protein